MSDSVAAAGGSPVSRSSENGRVDKVIQQDGSSEPPSIKRGLLERLRGFFGKRADDSQMLRETLDELIDEIDETPEEAARPIGEDERIMLSNILHLRHLTAYDVMVPRADIIALEINTSYDDMIAVFKQEGHSRLPVYRDTLDEVLGMVHIKDVVAFAKHSKQFSLSKLLRPVEVIAPSMRVLDLLLQMRIKRNHMTLIVDEFGGIDGLVTIEDLVEEIVGEIEDEHDVDDGPQMRWRSDGTLLVDARLSIADFEEAVGEILTKEEREEDVDTLGGFVFFLADRVPARGELVPHEHSGVVFEVVQADPRRVKRIRVHHLSKSGSKET
ncbi:hemolysin family protein [Rhodovibrionaceae bacterium A322]